jgi:PKD repeat protein
MKRNFIKALLINLAIIPATFGQQTTIDLQNTREGESVEYCKEHKLTNEMLQDPAFAKQWNLDREQLNNELQAFQKAKKDGSIPSKGVVYRIPVVIHILHMDGPENISKEQVANAIEIWNTDFRRRNSDANNVHPDFQGVPADTEIELVLATKAPDGTCFSGITRTRGPLTYDGSNGGAQADYIRDNNDVYQGNWPGNQYLNIFVCEEIGGAAGYTRRPFSFGGGATSMQNGIWCLDDYVGAIGTGSSGRSRTFTHECGHWLDLPHTWGGTNTPGLPNNCNDDDGVQDTPNTVGVQSCFLNENSCGSRANVENYMDYSYCSKMFTPGQKERMRTALNSTVGGRSNIWTQANMAATGADSNFTLCKADFRSPNTVVCSGAVIDFIDESFHQVSGWTWSFPGGTPATSTAVNPSVTYNTPGVYDVTLTVTDGSSTVASTKTGFVTVIPEGAALPYAESFENYTSLTVGSSFWTPVNISGSNEFQLFGNAGATGTKSVRLRNIGQPAGSVDELVSDNFDLTTLASSDPVTLSFKYAGKKRVASNQESLQVQVSKDCGSNWAVRKTLSGNAYTTEVQTSEFFPEETDWVQVHVTNISSSFFVSNLQVKFKFTSGGGNNLYIDDINFYKGDPSSLGLVENNINGIELFPNPSEGELNMRFESAKSSAVALVMRDLTGKIVKTININAVAGSNMVMMSTEDMASGMYMLNITTNGTQKTLPFVVK